MRYFPERQSHPAFWSRRLAVFALAVVILGILIGRAGVVAPLQGVVVVASGLALAAIAAVLALFAYVEIWRSGAIGLTRANAGLLLAAAILAYPAYLVVQSYRLPAINDISTDLRDLPSFSRSRLALEARAGHVPADSNPDVREQQRLAYPEVVPVVLELGPEEAYQLVLTAAQQMRWRIVDRSPPSLRLGTGRLDAADRTVLMRLPEDITIRIRPLTNQTRIDIRSVSRVGRHDLGSNAARIRRFSDILIDLNKGA
jgi:uncharacterized protein (DUF1499 family)